MAEHDYSIANDTGANVRTDINNALSAMVSLNSKSSAPSTTFAYMLWADTSSGILKQRNAANNAWVNILTMATGVPSAGTGISNVVEDTSPQLGANLDVQGFGLTSSSSIMHPTLTSTGKALVLGF